ncbi:YkgJ family cysteine cluster protein [Sphingomonas sp.]|uniref:YkgJ family cysteine cluster protein n=1 Tax=Sphingomonas sp. TaxID=28214 RepID=UPI0025E7CDA4|nr:YkgJ family cysteine cluster protein [Sphingomonas sp.]MBV9529430.1 YkgJ family cysteine cluster protein [Sphingomonas sp.]
MSGVRHFACTQCGKCCNRAPEVELSEAASLADVFVFRLLFRVYSLPRAPERGADAEVFYQKKRLLAAHAARKSPVKLMRQSKPVDSTSYLLISALALDTLPGACAALDEGRCSIHDRRPLGCRSVPFHYSRPHGLALADFDAFVATPGYACDTSEAGAPFLQGGRIVDAPTLQARGDALQLATIDRPWKEAIVRAMKRGSDSSLPSLADIEANAGFAAMTASMRTAWEIAADTGLLGREKARGLIQQQLATIEREVQRGERSAADWQTLQEMCRDYRQALRQAVVSSLPKLRR